MIKTAKPDRTDLDMIYEIMFKMGVPLSFPVFPLNINGKIAYSVGEDALLLVCLADGITPEDITTVADYVPAKIICAEQGFADDTAMSNAYYILKDKEIDIKLV